MSSANINKIADNTRNHVKVVRGEGDRATTYYYGDNQVLLKSKPSKASKTGYTLGVMADAVPVAIAGVVAAFGLIPVAAGILTVSVNGVPRFTRLSRSLGRNYKSEAVSPQGVETLETLDTFQPSAHNGFIPADQIDSIRICTVKAKASAERHA